MSAKGEVIRVSPEAGCDGAPTRIGPRHAHAHDTIGIDHVRRPPEEQPVHDAEHRAIRPDTEPQRQHRGQRQRGASSQRAYRVAQVLHERVDHSYLRATIGSIFVARQAGTRQARADPSVSSPMTPAYVAGSRRETPNNRATTARLAMNAVASPTTSPRTAKVLPCRTNRLMISPRHPPRADR